MRLVHETKRRLKCYREAHKYTPFYVRKFYIIEPWEYLIFSEKHLKIRYQKKLAYLNESLEVLQQIIDKYKIEHGIE